jgi:hypothetical protein
MLASISSVAISPDANWADSPPTELGLKPNPALVVQTARLRQALTKSYEPRLALRTEVGTS